MLDELTNSMTSRMDKTIEALKKDFIQIRSGKANPAMVEDIKVEYYGALTPLNQLGNITAPEPRQIVISPYDKTAIKDIERAIQSSGLGLTPNNDGSFIRINIPELTGERRKELAKVVRTKSEEKKVAIRNIRRDVLDELKKKSKDEASKISEDQSKTFQDSLQKVTDSYIAKIQSLTEEKEKEITTV
jgi:ribosome recycling factor